MKKKKTLGAVLLLLVALICWGIVSSKESQNPNGTPALPAQESTTPAGDHNPADPTAKPENTAELPADTVTLTLLAVGDNLIHAPIYRGAKKPDGSYDFAPIYQAIAPEVARADLAFVNQETPLGGEALGLAGYPKFNSPQAAGTALAEMGFQLISLANNHTMDAGLAGLERTAALWHSHTITPAGAGEKPMITSHGVTTALLAYTYGLNQGPLGHVAMIDREQIAQDVAAAKKQAQIILVSLHWGVEYQSQPSREQQELAAYLADLGVDVILGHHPHVVQPVARLPKAGGGETLVFYSLGNFVSNQDQPAALVGAMAQVELRYHPGQQQLSLGEVRLTPLITQYEPGYRHTRLIKWDEYTPELAAAHGSKALTYAGLAALIQSAFPPQSPPQSQF